MDNLIDQTNKTLIRITLIIDKVPSNNLTVDILVHVKSIIINRVIKSKNFVDKLN